MIRPRRVLSWTGGIVLGLGCQSPPSSEPTDADVERAPRPPRVDDQRLLSALERLASDEMRGRDSRDAVSIRKAALFLARAHARAGTVPVGGDYLIDFDLTIGSRPSTRHHLWVDAGGASVRAPPDAFVSISPGDGVPRVGPVRLLDRLGDGSGSRSTVEGHVVVASFPPEASADDVAIGLMGVSRSGALATILLVDDLERVTPSQRKALAVNSGSPILLATPEIWPPGSSRPEHARATVSLGLELQDVQIAIPNVVAYLPGTDLRDELVVIGGHYDHIGIEPGIGCAAPEPDDDPDDEICNGADDNASGTASVLEIATAIARSDIRLRRTLVFAHFAGEELGLHGSKALAETPPPVEPFTSGRVVAMLNMDMVGRYRSEPGLTVGSVASSPTWPTLLDHTDHRGLLVHYDRGVSSRSDHASYYRRDVPVLFFFTGLHADYHRTSDEMSGINREGLSDVTRFVLEIALALGDGYPVTFQAPTGPQDEETSELPGR